MKKVVTISMLAALSTAFLFAASGAEADHIHPNPCRAHRFKECPLNQTFDTQTVQVQLLDRNVLGLLANPGGPVERQRVQFRSSH